MISRTVQRTIPQLLRSQKGAITVLFGLALVALCGIAALVVDVGVLYYNKVQLVNAADAAALAGAQELPGRPSQAVNTANSYAKRNGKTADVVQTAIGNSNTSLTVTINRKVDLFFARIWGKSLSNLTASTTAQVKTFSGGKIGIVPFGIAKQTFIYGQTYKLKLGGGGGYDGNFQALALGGTGASVYLNNLMYGYNGTFHAGDWISTETGNMSGPTSQGVSYRIGLDPSATFDTVQSSSGRIVIVPIIDSLAVNGSTNVLVTGFAAFFLEGAPSSGNGSYVYGKFRQMVIPGDMNTATTNYGLYDVVLTR